MRLAQCGILGVLVVLAAGTLGAQGADSSAHGRLQPNSRDSVAPAPDSAHRKAFPTDSVRRTRKLGRIVTIDHTPMGDVRETDFVVAPTVSYSPETGFGGGAGLVLSRLVGDHLPDQRPATFQASLQLTQNEQYTITTTADIWTRHDRYRFTYEATVSHFPKLFFGIGPSTASAGEKWSPTRARVAGAAWVNVRSHVYVGLQGLAEHLTLSVNDTGPLMSGAVPGQLGWNVALVGVMASYDSRAPYYFPTHGALANLTLLRADRAIGSEFGYTRATLDMRAYRGLGGGHVLAGQLWADAASGTMPFDRMPQLGGAAILRGMWDGRFRDQGAMAMQGEYRSAAWHRVGVVTFAALGAVGSSVAAFEPSMFHFAGGVGLRIALTDDDRLNLRIDRGWGRGTSGTYFTIGEAF